MTDYCDDIISDMHKDAYGFRPREHFYAEWNSANRQEREKIVNHLQELIVESINEQNAYHKKSFFDWKKTIKNMMKDFNITRARAIRWHIESFDDEYMIYDLGFYCYQMGLAYKYGGAIEKLLKKFQEEPKVTTQET